MAVDTSTGLLPDDETFMTVTLRFSHIFMTYFPMLPNV